MSGFSRFINWVAFASLLCAGTVASAQEDVFAKARQLLKERKGAEAYRLLQPLSEANAGDPDFDLLYGMSAIDAGKPTEATFALERVLDAQPNNAAAQAELGRAYYDMGENDAAKAQFERVRGEKLPPTVEQNIDRYLNAIESRTQAARTKYRAYVEVGAGYDSNVNGATDQATVFIGALPFTLGTASVEQDSLIWSVDTGFSFTSPVAAQWGLFGGINLQHRADINDTECSTPTGGTSTCSTSAADGNIGLQYAPTEVDRYRISALAQRFYVGGENNRDLGAINADYTRTLGDSDQVSAFGQVGLFRFPDQHSRDVNRYVGGVGWGHAFGGHGKPLMFLSGYGGTEDDVEDNSGGIARDLLGARIGGEYSVVEPARVFGSFSYQKSWYDSPTPGFAAKGDREDDYLYLNGGVRYAVNRLISIRPEVRYTTNGSNVPITDFDRWEAIVFFRSDF